MYLDSQSAEPKDPLSQTNLKIATNSILTKCYQYDVKLNSRKLCTKITNLRKILSDFLGNGNISLLDIHMELDPDRHQRKTSLMAPLGAPMALQDFLSHGLRAPKGPRTGSRRPIPTMEDSCSH